MIITAHPQVNLVTHSASDSSVLQAMLVSTDPDLASTMLNKDPSGSEGRIRYLMKNRHGTPFEHNHFRFFVKAPIFVFREFHRHRIGWSYNEQSGRYSQLEAEFWVPAPDRPLVQTGKPGHYVYEQGSTEQLNKAVNQMIDVYLVAYETYTKLLDDGVAKEVARTVLPVGLYSSMYATCNARSLMAFLSLRTTDENATFPSTPMREIEEVARQMENYFSALMPITYQAFCDFGRVAP